MFIPAAVQGPSRASVCRIPRFGVMVDTVVGKSDDGRIYPIAPASLGSLTQLVTAGANRQFRCCRQFR
jgi:hypothetical protein